MRFKTAPRKAYPSDLTDEQWNLLAPLLHVHQLLEGLARFAIFDGEAVVEPLVQRDTDVRGFRVLLNQRSAVNLTLDLERTRPAGVDHIAEVADFVLEITVDEVSRHHVFFEDD